MKDRVRDFYFPLFKSQFKNMGIKLWIVEERWDWYVEVEWTAHIIPYSFADVQSYSFTLRSDYLTHADEEGVQIYLQALAESVKRRMMYELFVVERGPSLIYDDIKRDWDKLNG